MEDCIENIAKNHLENDEVLTKKENVDGSNNQSCSFVVKHKGILYINERAMSKNVSRLRFMNTPSIIHVEDPTGKLTFERENMWVNENHAAAVKKNLQANFSRASVPLTCFGRKEYPRHKNYMEIYNQGITKFLKEFKKKKPKHVLKMEN